MKIAKHSMKENPLLKRKDAWFSVEHAGQPTPSRKQLLQEAAKAMAADEELVIIDRILTDVGQASSRLKVMVYADKAGIPKAKLEKMHPELKQAGKKAAAEKVEKNG